MIQILLVLKTEKDIFAFLALNYVEPTKRLGIKDVVKLKKRKRCPRGTRMNKETGKCEKVKLKLIKKSPEYCETDICLENALPGKTKCSKCIKKKKINLIMNYKTQMTPGTKFQVTFTKANGEDRMIVGSVNESGKHNSGKSNLVTVVEHGTNEYKTINTSTIKSFQLI